MPYVDGFVLAVPKSKVPDYKKLARKHGKVWREHGALAYVECLVDDVPYGKHTSLPRLRLARGHLQSVGKVHVQGQKSVGLKPGGDNH